MGDSSPSRAAAASPTAAQPPPPVSRPPHRRPVTQVESMSAERACELLRGGGDVHAHGAHGGPSPLELARRQLAARAAEVGAAACGSARDDALRDAAALVVAASEPWSPRNAQLFPAPAMAFASQVALTGARLARRLGGAQEHALWEIWLWVVMPRCIGTRVSH
jgi:hypothetical protein